MSRGPEQLRLTPDERADLVAYIDGELPDASRGALSTKLTQSATARREVELLKKTWELLGHLPFPEVDPQFAERTITEIRQLELDRPGLGIVGPLGVLLVGAGRGLSRRSPAWGSGPATPRPDGSGRTRRRGWPATCRWPSTWTNTSKWGRSTS